MIEAIKNKITQASHHRRSCSENINLVLSETQIAYYYCACLFTLIIYQAVLLWKTI